MKTIDLHVHSLFSDGKKSIEEIIGIALKNNVGYLAFAEHYNLASYNVARRLAGDKIEIIVPNQIEPEIIIIENLWDPETGEKINTINPGRAGQTVKMQCPIKCKPNWILRRKKYD